MQEIAQCGSIWRRKYFHVELDTIRNYSAIFAEKQLRMQTVYELGK